MVDEFDSTDMADEALASVACETRTVASATLCGADAGFTTDCIGRMIEEIGLD